MCGIIGLTFQEDKYKVNLALQKMKHRGQNGYGIYTDDNITLGHVRLSVIDLSPLSYPLHNEDKSIYVVVNGEFYDFEKIRNSLIKKGHKFYTSTDAEILVHLYEEKGIDAVKDLNGEFAFILYDKNKNLFIAGRDRFGIKPLQFTYFNGEYYFASEVKALIELGITPELDQESLIVSSSMQYCFPDRTMFKNIYNVLPGYVSIIDLENKSLSNKKYWDINFTKDTFSVEELKEILIDSVKTRMVSDVPVCCALSGGLDSSLVYGIANQYKKTNAVTVAIDGSDFDESEVALRTTKEFGTNLDVLHLTSDKIIENFSDAVYMSEGLTINSHLVAKFLLSKMIRDKGYKVVLTGEGSDELFCGYPHFKQDLNIFYDSFDKDNKVSAGILNNYDNFHDYLSIYQDKLGFIPNFLKVKSSFGIKVLDLLTEETYSNYNFNSIPNKILSIYDVDAIKKFNKADTSAYLWIKIVLANYMLRTLADGTEMAHTIEGRVPFLDYRLFDIAGKIPIEQKIEGTIEKKILREIGKPYITQEVYQRTKQPFITPPLLINEKEYLYDHISLLPSFINKEKVNIILDKIYMNNNFKENVKYEPVLYFIYSLMHLIKRFNVKVSF